MMRYGGIFDVSGRRERLEEVERELAESDIWSDAPRAEVLARERAALEAVVTGLDRLLSGLGD
ncbi:MAG: peptide chain release factor 2, partial [Pseudomonadota bacterium]|nr:peptide chain release factor 2 [Pseudomonadota bacterium]MED5556361.1 peptide chain release factor 2 [Pseudomonadota bacterium]